MLTHHRRPVCLSFFSTDLPLFSTLETAATLYQKEGGCFHIVLKQPPSPIDVFQENSVSLSSDSQNCLLWLEVSPVRVVMTLQGNQNMSYRHLWERGIYGVSRYWLNAPTASESYSIRLRNFTSRLELVGSPLPHNLRLDYELWTNNLQLGRYVLRLEILH